MVCVIMHVARMLSIFPEAISNHIFNISRRMIANTNCADILFDNSL